MSLVYEKVVGVRQFGYKDKKTGDDRQAVIISLAVPNTPKEGNWGVSVHEYFIDKRSSVYPVACSLKDGDEVFPAERNKFVIDLILKENPKK